MGSKATASGAGGMALFTLERGELVGDGLLRAQWPDQLIRVQSRRHFRLTGLGGLRRRAWLGRPDAGTRLPLHDLSEEGVGVEMANDALLAPGLPGAAALLLDDEVIPVPLLQVVHAKTGPRGLPGTLGARLVGLTPEDLRRLRRWIATAQAECLVSAPRQP